MFTDIPLVCTDNPEKISSPAMWSSAKGGGAARENLAASPAVLGGRGWGGARGRARPIRVRVWGRRAAGEQARRRSAVVTVGADAPVKIGTGQGNTHRCELQDVLGQELGALMGSGCKRKEGLIVGASTATVRHGAVALPRARKERRRRFIVGASWRGGACTSRNLQDRGMGAGRRRRAACTVASALGGRCGDLSAWCARDGRGRRWTRRPLPLSLPRGARGTGGRRRASVVAPGQSVARPACHGARRRAWARTPGASRLYHLTWHCLNQFFSKFFNRSGPSDQQQSCKSPIPLQLWLRA
jgi:hypothetical protein